MNPSATEPLIEWDDIQGNILGGFNKDHQTLLGFRFPDNSSTAKAFISCIAGQITRLREVIPFKAERALRIALAGIEPRDMAATWMAVAFSFAGLKSLVSSADAFVDAEFRTGLAASSARLGDPAGSFRNWKIGGPGNVPDIFLTIAADRNADCVAAVGEVVSIAAEHGLEKTYHEEGHNLAFYSNNAITFAGGHEHFGFKDGISQPGIRGILPNGNYLTPRPSPSTGDDGPEFAEPGKPLIFPGQFVLGYAQQIDTFPRSPAPKQPLGNDEGAIAPAWARNGSFLVFRRLSQDVAAFRRFFADQAATLANPGMSASRLAALLVGRWPSGAPVIRSPLQDDSSQATDALINNFGFGESNTDAQLPNDTKGLICPVAAHIRKVNPRDLDTDQGSASATLIRRILRRGIPFGPPLDLGPDTASAERGLLFLSYQSSISQQFEFLCSQWMNSAALPNNPTALAGGPGFDLVLGQNVAARNRFAYVENGANQVRISSDNFTPKDWVSATGGGYFFAPSLSAIKDVLAAQ